jgi:hypothetical protein
MILPSVKNKGWVKHEIAAYYNFDDRFEKIKKKIASKTFKDNLQGVFGYVDEKTFDKHKKTVLGLEK